MITICAKLLGKECKKYNRLYLSLKNGCTSQNPNIYFQTRKLCVTKNLYIASPSVVKTVSIPNIPTNPQVVSFFEAVKYLGFQESEVSKLIINQPDLVRSRPSLWSDIVGALMESGFEKDEVLLIMENYPIVLHLKKTTLIANLMAWRGCEFGESLTKLLLTTHPQFLKTDPGFLAKRVKQYQLQFESKKRVGKLLLLAPNTLEESWSIVRDKLNYLNKLCTDNSDIAASGVLAHSLFHVKARHEFLIRAGLYKMPQKDFNKKLSKNPTLETIVNTSDDKFVSNVARLSLFEYNVFLEMFEDEFRSEIENGYESDYNSDDEGHKNRYKK